MSIKVDLQPTLTGQRVIVRPLQPEDWQVLFAAASDPLIWSQHPATDRYQEPVFREYFDSALECGSAFVFEEISSRSLIGSSRYHGHDQQKGEIEIGWTFLVRNFWGGSYNAEIKALMVNHALGFVDTVVFWVGEENVRSRRAMEKIGGVLRPGTHTRALSGPAANVIYEIRSGWNQIQTGVSQ